MSVFQSIVFGIIGFALFIGIMVLIIYLFVSIPILIKRPFEKKVDQIRKQYPLAYNDFIEKNHIFSFETSIIKLIRIIRSSSDWNETEERLKEQKRRKEIANSYNKWEKEQEEYRNNCLIIAKETMSNFGWYYYDIPFTKLNEREETVQGKYKIWQFFPGAYCLESDLDYSDFVSIKNNTKDILRFKSKEVCWPESVYEKINAFINELAKKYQISVYLNANKEEWSSESLNYHYNDIFESEFVSDKVEIYNSVFDPILNGEPLNSKLKNRHIIIIDMQTENGQLKSVCKRIIDNNKDKRPLITYISLLKGYDREEMLKLINEEKQKHKEEEEHKQKENEAEEKKKAELEKYKPNKEAFINLLQNNGIYCFYHFTARDNLALIRQHGGLYSWWSLKQKNIKVPFLGGEGFGQQLDVRHGLQDYVRLSFCNDHPMIFKHQQNGIDLVLLKIDIEVAAWKDSLFSDINATDNNHHHGGSISDLRLVNFDAVKRNYVSRDDDDFKPHQAEVMVKTFIPAKYIINLDSPLPL